jgi:ferredoxin-NADP reductase/MOSC domain-containing protein YiiM/ferredoxin
MVSRLVSVNVGLPKEVEWQGTRVRTGIWKSPVTGRVRARKLNLEGDGQGDLAGHGGEQRAVMVYQLDSYRYWQQILRRSDFTHGQFGENFTVEGLADAEVCIGDRYRIGSAVFEVTQPRVTCYRLGMRMAHAAMPALVVSHRRPGFYFRIIEEGDVGAGDVIEKIADGPGKMTVAEIDGLLYLGEHPPDALSKALGIPALSPGWQASLRALLEAGRQGKKGGNAGLSVNAGATLSWPGFRPLEVMTLHKETEDVLTIELRAPDGSSLPPSLPGQHIVLRLRPTSGATALTRTYSLCGAPDGNRYRIAVKKEKGPGSVFLHEKLRVGDRIESSAPRGSFTLARGPTPIVLLSAGIGVTPMLAMLHAAAEWLQDAPREVWWIHSARDGAHHAFAAEVLRLLKQIKGARGGVIFSRPASDDTRGTNFDVEGHVSLDLLRRLGVPADADFYLCGPMGYLRDLQTLLGSAGLGARPDRVHFELFGPEDGLTPGVVSGRQEAPHLPAGPAGHGPLVNFTRSHLSVRWDERFGSLLELAEACSVPVRWSCRTGVCHNCESGLIDGSVRYSPQPLDDPPQGQILICCSRPASDVELDL